VLGLEKCTIHCDDLEQQPVSLISVRHDDKISNPTKLVVQQRLAPVAAFEVFAEENARIPAMASQWGSQDFQRRPKAKARRFRRAL